MNREETIAARMADKLFSGRRGHGNTERIVERHLRYNEIKDIVKLAYQLGHQDGSAGPGEEKPEGPSAPERWVNYAVNDLLYLLQDYGVKDSERSTAAEYIVKLLRNVMSVSDMTRLIDEIVRRRG